MKQQKVHLIAIGGSAMHNIALDLHAQGYTVSGSDDEIYEPAFSRLNAAGILPSDFGWDDRKITDDLDFIILGMHAKIDNPELLKAQEQGIPVYSYPEFVYRHSIDKKRIVIAGSHGKTTTTAMIMHALKKADVDFDYLVGAQLDGFDRMVKLTDAPVIVIEGDEYLSSAIDRVPKIHHYKPHIAVITGIAWDHINVFPTFDHYKEQFQIFLDTMVPDGILFYYGDDEVLTEIVQRSDKIRAEFYDALSLSDDKKVIWKDVFYDIAVIGNHNLTNMQAAMNVCMELGISETRFLNSMADFTGANKRLQRISRNEKRAVYLDFAHAPSKVAATTRSFKDWFGAQKLLAVLELHTFSSLNSDFIPQYRGTLEAADVAIVFFNAHTLAMKNMPEPDITYIDQSFAHKHLIVCKDEKVLYQMITQKDYHNYHILLMTSGNFNKMPLDF